MEATSEERAVKLDDAIVDGFLTGVSVPANLGRVRGGVGGVGLPLARKIAEDATIASVELEHSLIAESRLVGEGLEDLQSSVGSRDQWNVRSQTRVTSLVDHLPLRILEAGVGDDTLGQRLEAPIGGREGGIVDVVDSGGSDMVRVEQVGAIADGS